MFILVPLSAICKGKNNILSSLGYKCYMTLEWIHKFAEIARTTFLDANFSFLQNGNFLERIIKLYENQIISFRVKLKK